MSVIAIQTCPCCVGRARMQSKPISETIFEDYIQCDNCGLRTESYNRVLSDPESAFWPALAAKWNRRDLK
jgi:transcription elongation factor Elf1